MGALKTTRNWMEVGCFDLAQKGRGLAAQPLLQTDAFMGVLQPVIEQRPAFVQFARLWGNTFKWMDLPLTH